MNNTNFTENDLNASVSTENSFYVSSPINAKIDALRPNLRTSKGYPTLFAWLDNSSPVDAVVSYPLNLLLLDVTSDDKINKSDILTLHFMFALAYQLRDSTISFKKSSLCNFVGLRTDKMKIALESLAKKSFSFGNHSFTTYAAFNVDSIFAITSVNQYEYEITLNATVFEYLNSPKWYGYVSLTALKQSSNVYSAGFIPFIALVSAMTRINRFGSNDFAILANTLFEMMFVCKTGTKLPPNKIKKFIYEALDDVALIDNLGSARLAHKTNFNAKPLTLTFEYHSSNAEKEAIQYSKKLIEAFSYSDYHKYAVSPLDVLKTLTKSGFVPDTSMRDVVLGSWLVAIYKAEKLKQTPSFDDLCVDARANGWLVEREDAQTVRNAWKAYFERSNQLPSFKMPESVQNAPTAPVAPVAPAVRQEAVELVEEQTGVADVIDEPAPAQKPKKIAFKHNIVDDYKFVGLPRLPKQLGDFKDAFVDRAEYRTNNFDLITEHLSGSRRGDDKRTRNVNSLGSYFLEDF